uniref:Uncharacterized protein n=1 Tax=Magallana gigas TaxID=29159 RepID=K1RVD1_MAGGI
MHDNWHKPVRRQCAFSHWLRSITSHSNNGPLARKYKITMIVMGSLLLALITAFIVILALYIKDSVLFFASNLY